MFLFSCIATYPLFLAAAALPIADAVCALYCFNVSLVKPFLKNLCSFTPVTREGKQPSRLFYCFYGSLKKDRLPTVTMPGLIKFYYVFWLPELEKSLSDAKGMVTFVGFD